MVNRTVIGEPCTGVFMCVADAFWLLARAFWWLALGGECSCARVERLNHTLFVLAHSFVAEE